MVEEEEYFESRIAWKARESDIDTLDQRVLDDSVRSDEDMTFEQMNVKVLVEEKNSFAQLFSFVHSVKNMWKTMDYINPFHRHVAMSLM